MELSIACEVIQQTSNFRIDTVRQLFEVPSQRTGVNHLLKPHEVQLLAEQYVVLDRSALDPGRLCYQADGTGKRHGIPSGLSHFP